jgi:hypothetical protein
MTQEHTSGKSDKLEEDLSDLRRHRFELFRGFEISPLNSQFAVDFFSSRYGDSDLQSLPVLTHGS